MLKNKEIWNRVFQVVIILSLMVSCVLVFMKFSVSSEKKEAIGKRVVLSIYEFSSADSLKLQQNELKKYTTEDVFNQLSLDNTERTIRTYVKYMCNYATVNFLKCTDSYVVFSLNSDYTTPDQHFIFMFDVDSSGKVCYAREAEVNEFFDCDY